MSQRRPGSQCRPCNGSNLVVEAGFFLELYRIVKAMTGGPGEFRFRQAISVTAAKSDLQSQPVDERSDGAVSGIFGKSSDAP